MTQIVVERVQTGVRLEKRLLKVLKALADYHDMTLGDLLEGIVLHAFEGQTPFGDESLKKIAELKEVFGLTIGCSPCSPIERSRGVTLVTTALTDADLIEQFEQGIVGADQFHHAQHVRLAWLFVRRDGLPGALLKFPATLQRFALGHGAPHLYHVTITWAYLLLIHARQQRCQTEAWEDFATVNADLLAWNPSILDAYYTPETLWSEFARQTFVMPDRGIHVR